MAAARSTAPTFEVGRVERPAISNDRFLDLSRTGNPGHQPTVATGSFLAARLIEGAAEAIANWPPELAKHLVMSTLEFMQRLAALMPRPWPHLIRFHGVLVSNARQRELGVPKKMPQQAEAPAREGKHAECVAGCAHHLPPLLSWAKLLERVFETDMEPGRTAAVSSKSSWPCWKRR